MSDERLNMDPDTIGAVERFRRSHDTAVLVVMFVDMVDSTSRREAMGAIRFELDRRRTDDSLRDVLIPDSRGLLLKSTGDGQLLVFTEPDQAVKRALAAQHLLRGNDAIPVRIGIDMGQVAIDETGTSKDVFGRQVNRAARIEALGDGGHVLVSYPVWDSAKSWLQHDSSISWREHRNCRLKGFAGAFSVFEAFRLGATAPLAQLRGQHLSRTDPNRLNELREAIRGEDPAGLRFFEIEIRLSETWLEFMTWLRERVAPAALEAVEPGLGEPDFHASGPPGRLTWPVRVVTKRGDRITRMSVDLVSEWLYPCAVEASPEGTLAWDTWLFPIENEVGSAPPGSPAHRRVPDAVYTLLVVEPKAGWASLGVDAP